MVKTKLKLICVPGFQNRFTWRPKSRKSRYEIPNEPTNSTPLALNERPVRPPRHIQSRAQPISPIQPVEDQVVLSPNNPFLGMINSTAALPVSRLELVIAEVNQEFSDTPESIHQPNVEVSTQSSTHDLNM